MLNGEDSKTIWTNVIVQSFIDLNNKGKEGEAKKNRKNAKKWININNKEFILVCAYADRDPKRLVSAKDKLLKGNYKLKLKRS